MKPGALLCGVLLGATVVVAACSSSAKSVATPSTTASAPTTAATAATSAATTTSTAPATGTLGLAANSKIGQQIIVNSSGRTVYLFVPDGASTTSKVPAGIKALWPPVASSGSPAVGAGLDQSKAAMETQPDGTQQVSYNGHLLYTFARDAAPGDANGQGLGGIWYVLSSSGDKIG
jgi:predicted lipoprotein with Yx(FWY)xxD motif